MKLLALITLCTTLLLGAVDINKANKTQLMTLIGIGSKKADAIINYRTSDCFNTIDDIVGVKGIGDKFLLKNRDNMSVSECSSK